jgi:hypothetical protein
MTHAWCLAKRPPECGGSHPFGGYRSQRPPATLSLMAGPDEPRGGRLFPWERHAGALEVARLNPNPAMIVFYGSDGELYGIATLDDAGRIRYSNDRVRDTMDACVITKGAEWAWAWFSRWSNGYSASKLVDEPHR